jgi:hypothetical protein
MYDEPESVPYGKRAEIISKGNLRRRRYAIKTSANAVSGSTNILRVPTFGHTLPLSGKRKSGPAEQYLVAITSKTENF